MASNPIYQILPKENSSSFLNRERIIEEYKPLIKFIAEQVYKRVPKKLDVQDLINCGIIGLIDAIEKFDVSRDTKFKTYAEFRIKGAMIDELRELDWVPRSVRQKHQAIQKAYLLCENRYGRTPTDEELAETLEISLDEYYELLDSSRCINLVSFEELHEKSENIEKQIYNATYSAKSSDPENLINVEEMKRILVMVIDKLNERERLIITLYYYEELTFKEIGEVLDLSESRISQIHARIIFKMKKSMKNYSITK